MAWGLGLKQVTWSLRASVFLFYKVGVITLSISLGSSASISDDIRSLWLRSTLKILGGFGHSGGEGLRKPRLPSKSGRWGLGTLSLSLMSRGHTTNPASLGVLI